MATAMSHQIDAPRTPGSYLHLLLQNAPGGGYVSKPATMLGTGSSTCRW